MKKSIFPIIAAVVTLAALTAEVRAANSDFCANYSANAVQQFVRYRSTGSFRGAGGRWHANYDVHYGWCLAHSYGAARSERAIRAERLRECM